MIKFDKKALQAFNQIPGDMKSKILSNVYCAHCNDTVQIVDFTAKMEKGDLVLKGRCGKCNHKVARLIEV